MNESVATRILEAVMDGRSEDARPLLDSMSDRERREFLGDLNKTRDELIDSCTRKGQSLWLP